MLACGGHGIDDLRAPVHRHRPEAVRLCQLDVVRSGDRDRHVPAIVEQVLDLPDHAQVAIVDDGNFDVDVFLHDGGQFGHRHLEAAVADDDPHFLFRAGDLRADGRRQRKSHRAEAARRDERPAHLVFVVLRLPHLMLPDVGDDERASVCQTRQIVHDVRGVQMALVRQVFDVADGGVAFAGVDVRQPVTAINCGHSRQPVAHDLAEIADDAHVDADDLVQL